MIPAHQTIAIQGSDLTGVPRNSPRRVCDDRRDRLVAGEAVQPRGIVRTGTNALEA